MICAWQRLVLLILVLLIVQFFIHSNVLKNLLKPILRINQQSIKKTHDLEFLVELCSDFESDFITKFFTHAQILNPYCFEFRYPADDDDFMIPDFDEVQKAIELAEEVYNFVIQKINL